MKKMRVRKRVVVVALVVLALLDLPSQIASQIGIHPKRSKLMKDALSWVAFRRHGEPIDAATIEKDLYPKLSRHYAASKGFRAFVIAFEVGVSPRPTKGYGIDCDFKYMEGFKNPENGLLDWYGMKKLVFDNYKNRPTIELCDYRQGLVCLPSGKCGCKPDAIFSALSSSASSEKGCVLDVDKPCAIPDLDQGTGAGGYKSDAEFAQLVFNLERPETCKPGTECRNLNVVAKCHDKSKIPPDDQLTLPSGEWAVMQVLIGMECPLGMINNQARCKVVEDDVGSAPGYVCYKFDPPGKFSRTGYCAHEFGSYQIYDLGFSLTDGRTDAVLWRRNFIMGFVNRHTVPAFDDKGLKAHYKWYLKDVYPIVFPSHEHEKWMLKLRSGDSCNVKKTQEMGTIWKFYADLAVNPPSTTTTLQMNATLTNLKDLVEGNKGGICKVYWSYHYADYKEEQHPDQNSPKLLPPLKCDKNPSATGDDNDGLCVVDPNGDYTKPFAEKVQTLSNYALKGVFERITEEKNKEYLQILKDNPEPDCKPVENQAGSLRISRSLWPLEDFSCPPGSICLTNYEDPDIFDGNCNLKPGQQQKVCLEVPGTGKYGKCEGKMLDKEIMKEIETIAVDKDLLWQVGENCQHGLENRMRAGVKSGEWTGNKRELLAKLVEERVQWNVIMCDRSRLLECNDENRCACVSGTNQREVKIMDSGTEVHYKSEYCYLTSGKCSGNGLQDFLKDLPLTQKEIDLINNHYGAAEGDCSKGNHCMFVDDVHQRCTARDTGKTGHDLKPDGDGNNGDGNGGGGNGGGSIGGGGSPGGSNPPGNGSPRSLMLWTGIVGGLLVVLLVW